MEEDGLAKKSGCSGCKGEGMMASGETGETSIGGGEG